VGWPPRTNQSGDTPQLQGNKRPDPRISLLAFQTGDPRWCSFLHAKERGWNVKKGSKATPIFFTKQLTVKDAKEGGGEPEDKTVRMLRHYPVFHASQIEGIPPWLRGNHRQVRKEAYADDRCVEHIRRRR
jgi:antirestriction protein ArdC